MKYEVISTVCETENLTKAARRLNYSQSAVSQVIQNFEKELGITLFERSKSGVKPLPGVKPIIESLNIIGEEEKKIKEFAESIRELDHGVVRMGALSRIITKWFPDIFQSFGEEFPNIRYEVLGGSLQELRQRLEKEEIDFAFMSSMGARGYAFTPLIKDELVVLFPRKHRLSAQKSVSIQELKKENIMLPSESLDFEIGEALKGIDLHKGEAKFYFEDDIVIMKFVEKGFGVCVLPRLFVDIIGKEFDLEIKSFDKKAYRILGIAYPNKKYMTPASTKFLDYVFKWFKDKENQMLTLP